MVRIKNPFKKKSCHILITAGPTREYLDPVRYLSNESSGLLGIAIAAAFKKAGAKVTLVLGPVSVKPPRGVIVRPVVSALQMKTEVFRALPRADIFISAAAVADYRARRISSSKIKKGPAYLRLELVQNPDILFEVGQRKARMKSAGPLIVGFGLETSSLIKRARKKMIQKNCDLFIANSPQTFGSQTITGFWLERKKPPVPFAHSKKQFAAKLVKRCKDQGSGRDMRHLSHVAT